MGCFDSVMVPCPTCKTPSEFQSKSGECSLSSYTLEDAPEDVLVDVNRHSPNACHSCGAVFLVNPSKREALLVDSGGNPDDERIKDQIRACYVCGKEQPVAKFNLCIDNFHSVGEFGDAEDLYICDADVGDVLQAVAKLRKIK